ncbi:MAG TPA: 50S ribosomal protein L25 [Betaproteobacteria bacterium]|nr:50S ribosomal protein L25 [Betaproteobacteria bacterium]
MHIEINAQKREMQGTGASRRLRHAGRVPGVVYGGDKPAQMIDLDHNELYHQLKQEAFHASILSLNFDGGKEQVLLRDTQMHPYKQLVMHVDFQRVSQQGKVHMKVPLHFINAETAPGVKLSHGTVTHVMTEVDVSCLPKDLPEFITVDLGSLEAGHSIHLSGMTLPAGVELVDLLHGNDKAAVSIATPRGGVAAAEGEGEAAAEGGE